MANDEFLKKTVNLIVDCEEKVSIYREDIKLAYQEAKTKGIEIDVLKKVVSDRIKGVSPDENEAKYKLYKEYVEAVY